MHKERKIILEKKLVIFILFWSFFLLSCSESAMPATTGATSAIPTTSPIPTFDMEAPFPTCTPFEAPPSPTHRPLPPSPEIPTPNPNEQDFQFLSSRKEILGGDEDAILVMNVTINFLTHEISGLSFLDNNPQAPYSYIQVDYNEAIDATTYTIEFQWLLTHFGRITIVQVGNEIIEENYEHIQGTLECSHGECNSGA